jgi:hypothetical protein
MTLALVDEARDAVGGVRDGVVLGFVAVILVAFIGSGTWAVGRAWSTWQDRHDIAVQFDGWRQDPLDSSVRAQRAPTRTGHADSGSLAPAGGG